MSYGFLDFGNIGGKASALAFAESPFDENGFPKPWVIAIAIFGHLLLLVTLINIEPMIIKKDDVVYGVDIVKIPPTEKVPPQSVEAAKVKPAPQTEMPPILQQAIPEPEPQQTPQILTPERVPEEVKPEIIQPAKVQISPQQIQMQKSQKLKAPNIDKIEEKEEINLAPVPNLNIKTPQFNKLQSPDLDVKRPINAQKLDAPNNIKTINPNINRPANDLRINVDELNRNYEEQQRQADIARQKSIDEQKQKQDNLRDSANAPKANGGELAQPFGGSSGVTAIGGGGVPSGGASGGVLPNAPKSYGGRNVFEENENGSLLARMGRTADCAGLNRQRDEKCPNWEPLDGHLGSKVAPKVQPQYKAPPTHVDPLPACPPGTPKSNFGLSCLPAKN